MTDPAAPSPGRRRRRGVLALLVAGEASAGAALTAYLPLLPLAILAVLLWLGGDALLPSTSDAFVFVSYGALLLTFYAGLRFGQAVRVQGIGGPGVFALLPLIASAAALFIPPSLAIGLLAAGHAALGSWDVWSTDRGRLPRWYGQLRFRSTVIAVVLLVAGLLALELAT